MRCHAVRRCVLIVFLLQTWRAVYSYNVDVSSATVVKGDKHARAFGFSVAFYQHAGDDSGDRLIVGAPDTRTPTQPGVEQPGAVYQCRLGGQVARRICRPLVFDDSGNRGRTRPDGKLVDAEDKSFQWLGATVATGMAGVIVACAPRYVFLHGEQQRKLLIGHCYVSRDLKSTSNATILSPCELSVSSSHSKNDQQDKQGKCQAGFSAAVSLRDSRLLIGAVGSWYWQGQVFNYRLDLSRRLNVLPSHEKTEEYDDGLRGYSVAVGKFGRNNMDYYSVGSPKSQKMYGEVTVMNQGLGEVISFIGTQVGAFFGYSQACGDFDGDGNDDLAVGAPFYSDYISSSSHDQGRVFIYYQKEREFKQYTQSELVSTEPGGQFGQAVAAISDLNNDGYHDLCVGVPYGGKDRRGVLHVYHGSADGVKAKPSQTITAESIDPEMRTFGFSLATRRITDQPDYSYPDLAVGAYESNSAVYLRTRPIVYTTASLNSRPDIVRLKDVTCKLADGTFAVCFEVEFCLEYSGLKIDDQLYFNLSVTVDSGQSAPRAYIGDGGDKNAVVSDVYLFKKNSKKCDQVTVYMKKKFRDKLSEMSVVFKYDLFKTKSVPSPILDDELPKSLQIQVRIWKDCGKDSLCIPDLAVELDRAPHSYMYGSGDKIPLEFTVTNRKEGAYEALMVLTLPDVLSLANVEMPGKPSVIVGCHRVSNGTIEQVVCDLGNPLPPSTTIKMIINLRPKRAMFGNVTAFDINCVLSSENNELPDTLGDNTLDILIPVVAEPMVILRGASFPTEVFYNKSHSSSDLSTSVRHIYEFQNTGFVDIFEAEILVVMPSVGAKARKLVSFSQDPSVINGTGSCHVTEATSADNNVLLMFLKKSKASTLDQRRGPWIDTLGCTHDQCQIVICDVNKLESGQRFVIYVDFELSLQLIQSRPGREHLIVSQGVGRVASLYPQLRAFNTTLPLVVHNVTTRARAQDLPARDIWSIPIWIIVISVIAGILLILIIVLILWRLGFFKRYKPPHKAVTVQPEQKPLM